MVYQVGEIIPDVTVRYCSPPTAGESAHAACGLPVEVTTHELFKGKKVIIFAVPGAFTPTCHVEHIPGYLKHYDALKQKGADLIVCLATNDAFVMNAWGKSSNVEDKILMLSDGNSELITKLGLSFDATKFGLGNNRAARFAIVLDDLKATYVGVEPSPGVTVSGAEAVLAKL